MVTLDVVKKQHGWCIRSDPRMTTHFLSPKAAARETLWLAATVGRQGVRAEVIVEGDHPNEAGTHVEAQTQTSALYG